MDYWELLEEQHEHDVILHMSQIDGECEDYCEIKMENDGNDQNCE